MVHTVHTCTCHHKCRHWWAYVQAITYMCICFQTHKKAHTTGYTRIYISSHIYTVIPPGMYCIGHARQHRHVYAATHMCTSHVHAIRNTHMQCQTHTQSDTHTCSGLGCYTQVTRATWLPRPLCWGSYRSTRGTGLPGRPVPDAPRPCSASAGLSFSRANGCLRPTPFQVPWCAQVSSSSCGSLPTALIPRPKASPRKGWMPAGPTCGPGECQPLL